MYSGQIPSTPFIERLIIELGSHEQLSVEIGVGDAVTLEECCGFIEDFLNGLHGKGLVLGVCQEVGNGLLVVGFLESGDGLVKIAFDDFG